MSAKHRYKWDSPYEWLTDAAKGWDSARLYQELCNLAIKHDSDTLQDEFQADMDADGYFGATGESDEGAA